MARDNITQTQVRLPNELLEALKVSAEKNLRSLNAEITYQLQVAMGLTLPHASPDEVRQIVREELSNAGVLADPPEREPGHSVSMQRKAG